MTEYRVYLLDERGKIADAFSLEAPSVQSVIITARGGFVGPFEVWEGANRLAVLEALQPGLAK